VSLNVQPHVTGTALLAEIDAGTAPAVLDVRSHSEFVRGHVPGALHVPFWKLPTRASDLRVSPAAPVVVYCGHGPRAYVAGAVLRALGFRRVLYLAGHMSRWKRDGLREETGAGSPAPDVGLDQQARRRS
jgi:rhodanese-related sulfurtransferase